MPDEAGYTFGEDEVRRIAQSVVRSERGNRNHQARRRRHVTGGVSFLIGKADGAIAKNASGTVSVWGGEPGSETDSGENIAAYNLFAAVASGAWVAAAFNGYGWYLIATECV